MKRQETDTVLEEILAGFDRVRTSQIRHASLTVDIFNAAVASVPNDAVRAHHVAAFAEQSARYPSEDVELLWGFYVSALAAYCVDKTIEVSTEALRGTPRYVGAYFKGGTLAVVGNVGNFFGLAMRSGKLVLSGNAGYGVGSCMRARNDSVAEIIVNGNCGEGVGDRMDECATGKSIIRVEGSYAGLGRPILGGIYHHGQQVWPQPRPRRR